MFASDSCGGTNQMSKLTKLATGRIGPELNRNRINTGSEFTENHLNSINKGLEEDFSRFTGDSGFIGTLNGGMMNSLGNRAGFPKNSLDSGRQEWVSDFSRSAVDDFAKLGIDKLTIDDGGVSKMNFRQQQQSYQPYQPQYYQYQHQQLFNFQQQQQLSPNFQQMPEHRQLHHQQQSQFSTEDELFELAFSQIEVSQDQQSHKNTSKDPIIEPIEHQNYQNHLDAAENDALAKIATSISNTMENVNDKELSSKFEKSAFLGLMHEIRGNKVGLNSGSLVDIVTGEAISKSVDAPKIEQTSRLEDPLSFIEPSEILGSEQSRKLINERVREKRGGQIPPTTIDEIFSDYSGYD